MEERIYRNIWKEIGISDAQVEERLSQLISTFFYDEKERLYFPVGDDMAYIEDTGNNDARTEGMSYGMMLCVQASDMRRCGRLSSGDSCDGLFPRSMSDLRTGRKNY